MPWGEFLVLYTSGLVAFHFFCYFVEKFYQLLCWVGVCSPSFQFDGDNNKATTTVGKKQQQQQAPFVTTKEVLMYDTPIRASGYEIVKTVVMIASGLAIFRSVVGFFVFAFGAGVLQVLPLCPRPIRSILTIVLEQSSYFMLFWVGFYTIRRHGKLQNREGVKVIVSNHVTVADPILLFCQGFPSFVSRVENLKIPLMKTFAQVGEAILVDRSDENSRKTTLEKIERLCNNPKGKPLLLFPEGTCSNQKALFQFRRGAFVNGRGVQPVAFKYPYYHFNPCFTGSDVGGNDLPLIILRMCCQFVNRVEFKFLDPYYPSEEEQQDAELFANNVQNLIATTLKCGISKATYRDYAEAHERRKANKQKQN